MNTLNKMDSGFERLICPFSARWYFQNLIFFQQMLMSFKSAIFPFCTCLVEGTMTLPSIQCNTCFKPLCLMFGSQCLQFDHLFPFSINLYIFNYSGFPSPAPCPTPPPPPPPLPDSGFDSGVHIFRLAVGNQNSAV